MIERMIFLTYLILMVMCLYDIKKCNDKFSLIKTVTFWVFLIFWNIILFYIG